MESLISKIINIEDRAQKIISTTEEEKEQIYKDIDEQILELETKIQKMVEIKKGQLIQKAHDEADEKIIKLKETTKNKLEAMNNQAAKNMKDWEDSIYNSVIRDEE